MGDENVKENAAGTEARRVYEAPRVEALGSLGEIIRGTGSLQFDLGNFCATPTGPDDQNDGSC